MVKIATVCMHCPFDKEKNMATYFSYIEKAANEGANLIVFPEQSYQGYLETITQMPYANADYQYEHAEIIPGGTCVNAMIEQAQKYNMYIIWGMTEHEPTEPYKLYNTTVLVGPEGYVGKYRKVHLPYQELHIFAPGHDFPVFNTTIGKIGMLICYDKQFPESARELALGGAEILVMPTAWPFEGTTDDVFEHPEDDLMVKLYKVYDTCRAIENQCIFVSSDQAGTVGDIRYCGYSTITDGFGRVRACTGVGEGIAYADFDLKKEIIEYRNVEVVGINMLGNRHPEAYHHLGNDGKE